MLNFSSLVGRMDFILHILIVLNILNDSVMVSFMLDHSKIRKTHFWMIQRAKKEVFGYFLKLGLLDRPDIAYFDSTKWCPKFYNVTRS